MQKIRPLFYRFMRSLFALFDYLFLLTPGAAVVLVVFDALMLQSNFQFDMRQYGAWVILQIAASALGLGGAALVGAARWGMKWTRHPSLLWLGVWFAAGYVIASIPFAVAVLSGLPFKSSAYPAWIVVHVIAGCTLFLVRLIAGFVWELGVPPGEKTVVIEEEVTAEVHTGPTVLIPSSRPPVPVLVEESDDEEEEETPEPERKFWKPEEVEALGALPPARDPSDLAFEESLKEFGEPPSERTEEPPPPRLATPPSSPMDAPPVRQAGVRAVVPGPFPTSAEAPEDEPEDAPSGELENVEQIVARQRALAAAEATTAPARSDFESGDDDEDEEVIGSQPKLSVRPQGVRIAGTPPVVASDNAKPPVRGKEKK